MHRNTMYSRGYVSTFLGEGEAKVSNGTAVSKVSFTKSATKVYYF